MSKTVSPKKCQELYVHYKDSCSLVKECKFLTSKNTIEDMNSHIAELIKRFLHYDRCIKERLAHTKLCYNNILDYGHAKYLETLSNGKVICKNEIERLKVLISKKELEFEKTRKLMNKLKGLESGSRYSALGEA